MSALVIDFAERRAAIRASRLPFDPYGLVIPAALSAGAAFWIWIGFVVCAWL